MKIVETSLNLRLEKGKHQSDYTLSSAVAKRQLMLHADVYANVEYMEGVDDAEYRALFEEAGYCMYSAVDQYRRRGVLYAIRKEYAVEEVMSFEEPHMFHVRISTGKETVDLITARILVAGSDAKDFWDRSRQWSQLMDYLDGLEDKSRVLIVGDWNHARILEEYTEKHNQRFFNYQAIVKSLKEREIDLFEIDGVSYRGYLKIDHIASGKSMRIANAAYVDAFKEFEQRIGVPDHKVIEADVLCA